MSLLIWAVVGALAGFAICALASRKFNHRIAPAVLLAACAIALGVARWADGQPGQAAVLQAQAFIVGYALFASVVGGLGWLIFARQRWAMITSGVLVVLMLAGLPFVLQFLSCPVAGICAL